MFLVTKRGGGLSKKKTLSFQRFTLFFISLFTQVQSSLCMAKGKENRSAVFIESISMTKPEDKKLGSGGCSIGRIASEMYIDSGAPWGRFHSTHFSNTLVTPILGGLAFQ